MNVKNETRSGVDLYSGERKGKKEGKKGESNTSEEGNEKKPKRKAGTRKR